MKDADLISQIREDRQVPLATVTRIIQVLSLCLYILFWFKDLGRKFQPALLESIHLGTKRKVHVSVDGSIETGHNGRFFA